MQLIELIVQNKEDTGKHLFEMAGFLLLIMQQFNVWNKG